MATIDEITILAILIMDMGVEMEKDRMVLNHLFVNVFNQILKIEEKVIREETDLNLTVTEMHVIEAMGKTTAKTMTEVADKLNITLGTLTASINRLLEKGYVERTKDGEDRRIVRIALTPKGMEAFDIHNRYHGEMMDSVLTHLNDAEAEVLSTTLVKISDFFRIKYET